MSIEYSQIFEQHDEHYEQVNTLNCMIQCVTHTHVMDNGYREGNYRVSLTPLYRIRPVNIGESKSRSLSH